MADQLPVSGLPTLTGALQGGVNNLINTGSGYIDRFFPPEKREALKSKLAKFATERPKLAAFLLSQIALSGPALALFLIMSITVVVFALLAGILVGLIGALLFIVFCVGVALLFLLPTLFFTTFAGVAIFLWGLGAYYIVKWFNQKDVPGVHTDMTKGVTDQLGLGGILGNGPGEIPGNGGDTSSSTPEKPHRKKEPLQEKKNATTNGHTAHEGDEKENKPPSSTKTPNSANKRAGSTTGKGTGADVGGSVGDVKKKAGGVTDGVSGVTGKVGL